jgi:hypothetical protein
MLIRETGIDPKQISQELQTYADSYAQWGAEKQMRVLYYPPNLAALQDYMRMYGGDPDWQPRPPNTDRLDQFRKVLAYTADPEPAPAPAPAAAAAPAPQPPAQTPVAQPAAPKNALRTPARTVPGITPVLKKK